MPVSQNGFSANDRSVIRSYPLPGGNVALRSGPTGELLAWVARRFNAEVERLIWPGVWGYAERPIRGSTTVLSNHASGTAIDLNAPRHPLGTAPTATFSASQIGRIRRIVADTKGAIRWGGDYIGRQDPMHFEIDADAATVARVWTALNAPKEDVVTEADIQKVAAAVVSLLERNNGKLQHTEAMVGGVAERQVSQLKAEGWTVSEDGKSVTKPAAPTP